MSSCRIRIERLPTGLYEVRRTERGDCYGYPIKRDAYECSDEELNALVMRLREIPSNGIPVYTDISVVSTPELQQRLCI